MEKLGIWFNKIIWILYVNKETFNIKHFVHCNDKDGTQGNLTFCVYKWILLWLDS